MSAEIADFYKNGLHPGTERTAAQKYTPELQTILLKPAIFALRNCCGSDHNRALISE